MTETEKETVEPLSMLSVVDIKSIISLAAVDEIKGPT